MLNPELEKDILSKVRHVEYEVRKLIRGAHLGVKASPFRGHGMTFSDIRQYEPGDDIRNFAWQVMAKTGSPYIKQFEEERDLEVHVAFDVGPSMKFGGLKKSKFEIQAYLLAFLGLATQKSKDKFGGILFSHKLVKRFQSLRGEDHIRRCLYSLLTSELEVKGHQSQTDLALDYFSKLKNKNNLCILISDFTKPLNRKLLARVRAKNPLHLVHIYDPYEVEFPKMGWLNMSSLNSPGDLLDIKFSASTQLKLKYEFESKVSKLEKISKGFGAHLISQSTHDENLNEMTKFLKLGRLNG